MKQTIKELHQASQYLAAAGISLLDKKADDSHTNLGWNKDRKRLETHVFLKEFQFGLNLSTAKLELIKGNVVTGALDLRKNTHNETLSWLKDELKKNDVEQEYNYQFHYELPYDKLKEEDRFTLDSAGLSYIALELTKGQDAFEQFLQAENLDSQIRIWPHHFDLGIYAKLADENTFMGAGLAIPDSLVDDLYFYASGYKKGESIKTISFVDMKFGDWRTDWDGATLASANTSKENAIEFLNEAKINFNK